MKEMGSFSVLAEFVGKVDLPIMLAGGIADKKSVQASFMLGAEGGVGRYGVYCHP